MVCEKFYHLNESGFELISWNIIFVPNFGFKMSDFLLILSSSFTFCSIRAKKMLLLSGLDVTKHLYCKSYCCMIFHYRRHTSHMASLLSCHRPPQHRDSNTLAMRRTYGNASVWQNMLWCVRWLYNLHNDEGMSWQNSWDGMIAWRAFLALKRQCLNF